MSTALGANVMAHLHELARCTSEPGKLTRLYLTPGPCRGHAAWSAAGWKKPG